MLRSMIDTLREGYTINRLAVESGLEWYEVKTLIKEHAIPCLELGNRTIILPDKFEHLVQIILRYPGVNPAFARPAD
jgi:hypothetical protein